MDILKGKFIFVSMYNGDDKINEYMQMMLHFKKYVKLCSVKLMNRIYGFLRTRLPLIRTDLLYRHHWVWDLLRANVQKIAAIMILSGHIVEHDGLLYRDDDECILATRQICVYVLNR